MSISPFSARPASPDGERRRARLVVAIATLGIAATLLAYAIAPGVRHAVSHAAHSVKHAVGNVIDRDANEHLAKPAQAPRAGHQAKPTPSRTTTTTTTR
jgi:hypothetical protein